MRPLLYSIRVPEDARLRVLFTRQQISARVAELAAAVSLDFAGGSVILLGVLQGASIFMADLARALTIGATFDFIGVASYGKSTQSSGEVRITKDPDQPVEGRNVIVVEDILDTGLTLNFISRLLLAHQPKALRVAALLDKTSRRGQPFRAEYVGYRTPAGFVLCFGR